MWSPEPAENLEILLYGLRYLRRRGPEGVGAALVDPQRGSIATRQATSQDEEVIFEGRLRQLSARIYCNGYEEHSAISLGQRRYITDARTSDVEERTKNTQPIHIIFDGRDGVTDAGVGVHNGNISRKQELVSCIRPRAPHLADVDSRFLIEYLMQQKRDGCSVELGVAMTMDKLIELDGAASVIFSDGKVMAAFRDVQGYRPLVYGEIGRSKVIVSESGFFEEAAAIYGREHARFVNDVMEGELLIVDAKGNLERRVLRELSALDVPQRLCSFEPHYMMDHLSIIRGASARSYRRRNGEQMAGHYERLLEGVDFVVPVVKSGISYAEGFSYRSGICLSSVLQKPSIREDVRPDARFFLGVKTKAQHSYVVDGEMIRSKRLAVIDDSLLRAHTVEKVYTLLKDAGARDVLFFSCWPPTPKGCPYGVDLHDDELIARELVSQGVIREDANGRFSYDLDEVNDGVTKLVRARITARHGDRYGTAGDLHIYYASIDVVRDNLPAGGYCFDCVVGGRDIGKISAKR